MLAQVIVDVPSQNTDQTFTYRVPAEFTLLIMAGMRVTVPFGKGDRFIQGFVMELVDDPILETQLTDEGVLKNIGTLMDVEPVLNDELLQMADYLQQTTYAFKILCLQTMLPSVLKADYDKEFVAGENLTATEREIFQGQAAISFDEAQTREILPALARLKAQGKVSVNYHVIARDQVKTERYFKSALDAAGIAEARANVRKNAAKQLDFLAYLARLVDGADADDHGTGAGNHGHGGDVRSSEVPVKDAYALGFDATFLRKAESLGWLIFSEREVYRNPFAGRTFGKTQALQLTDEQAVAVEKIDGARVAQQATTFLLEGITGSGKTEVYLQTIARVLKDGQTALMLVPEIALTPQMVTRFKERFGDQVAVLHSGLSTGERYDEWRKIWRHEAQVVVGARSAIFAPLEHLGLIIIDEEHETTYKQSEAPRYHARTLALWRAQYHHCPLILGSATPSLESRARADKHVYERLTLTVRPNAAHLPAIQIVDLSKEYQAGNGGTFSASLKEKIQDRLDCKQQTVLLLNRRGYSSFVMCRDCGYVVPCPNCDISLTLHMDTKQMKCHYCGHEEPIPRTCPKCHSTQIRYYGTGTQKVEEELQKEFPSARIIRMDVDTTRKKGAHEKLLARFERHEADILLGTQMIAKGLDYPLVTLVGVLNADTALNLPDFRSSEHTFQLLTQVAGRAGRGDLPGEVIIQTFNPTHYAIKLAQTHDYEGFYHKEMQLRHLSNYPPYYYTVQLTCSHAQEDVAAKTIFQFYRLLKEHLSERAIFVGPSPKAILRINNMYYYQLLIKYKKEEHLDQLLHLIQNKTQEPAFRTVKISIDVEPLQFI